MYTAWWRQATPRLTQEGSPKAYTLALLHSSGSGETMEQSDIAHTDATKSNRRRFAVEEGRKRQS